MKKKRIGILVTGMTVVALIAVGFTLALLNATTGVKANSFSSNKNISIQLREPTWDGYTFEDLKPGDGTTAKDPSDRGLGVNQAKNYVPGQTIPKNPTVMNNGDGDGIDAYVAIKVQYYKGMGDDEDALNYDAFKTRFLKENGITFNEKWTLIDTDDTGAQIYFYKDVLAVGNEAEALFTEIPLSMDLEPDEDTGRLPSFNIKVQAFAIQTVGIDDPAEEMKKFVNVN